MKTFDVPDFIEHPTGVFCIDVLPVLTLFPACLTLNLFRKSRRYADLFIFTVGFLLAVVYHWCQLNPKGLANSSVLSIDGTLWRTLDVLCCPVMLTRTGGHIFGTSNIPLRILPDVLFPSLLVTLYFRVPEFGISMISNLALGVMLITAFCVVLFHGKEAIPQYESHQGKVIFFSFAIAVLFLTLPNFCGSYWLFHSLWHLFLAIGYYTLYLQIERPRLDRKMTNGKTI